MRGLRVKGLRGVFLVAVFVAAVCPSAGLAAFATVQGGQFVYDAADGEANRAEFTFTQATRTVTIRDVGAMITAEAGCVQVTAQEVTCSSVSSSRVFLRDLDDTIAVLEGGAPGIRGGDPHIFAGDGNDTIAGCAECRLFAAGGNGDDVITANGFLLIGNSGNDTITGGVSYNRINGVDGHDTLSGGGGSDWFIPGVGNDIVRGGPGADVVDFAHAQGPVMVNLATGQGTGQQGEDTFVSIRNVHGTYASDHLIGDEQGNLLKGGVEDDVIEGGGGDDVLVGEHGRDTLRGGPGSDGFRARDGARDVVRGASGRDWARVDRGLDRVFGIQMFR
jgi:Ca2+-binding RTX toxin-like protein